MQRRESVETNEEKKKKYCHHITPTLTHLGCAMGLAVLHEWAKGYDDGEDEATGSGAKHGAKLRQEREGGVASIQHVEERDAVE